jgi:SAM-dependent methyltransferase
MLNFPFMKAASTEILRSAHLRNLQDEEIGTRYRILNYYLPLFRSYCKSRQLDSAEVRILDCGCGGGASVEYLSDAGFKVIGIDIAQFRRDQWKERENLPRVSFVQADAVNLPFADKTFNIVVSSGMLEHIGVDEECEPKYRVRPLPDQSQRRKMFLAECLRVLQPQGVLYLDHPNGSFPMDFWHNDYRSRPRLHWPSERFLPKFREVSRLARGLDPTCTVEAISPAGRFTFRRSDRRWYGKLFSNPIELFFRLLRHKPFTGLSASVLNPYLVIRIARNGSLK